MLHYYFTMSMLMLWTAICVPFAILSKLADPKGNLAHWIGRHWSRGLLKISRMNMTVKGLEHLDPGSQYVFISNHTSAFDIPAIYWGLEHKLGMLAKKQLKYVPFFGWAMWAAGHFFVDRKNHKKAMAIMDQVAQQLHERGDHSLVVFVEGTRSLDGQLGRFKKGAFLLSMDTGIPIVPVIINGAFTAKGKKERRIRPTDLELVVLPPMDPSAYTYETRAKYVEDARDLFVENYQAP